MITIRAFQQAIARLFLLLSGLSWLHYGCLVTADDSLSSSSELCGQNLGIVFKAVQQFRHLHRDLPERLTDLVSAQLIASNKLICPVTPQGPYGATGNGVAYGYQFEARLLTNDLTKGLGLTLRQWRQLQMGRVGSEIPLIRCTNHARALNLAFNGTVYESGDDWEDRFTNVVRRGDLTLESLLAQHLHMEVVRIPAREPGTPREQIDLTAYYNRGLAGSTEWEAERMAIRFPEGKVVVNETAFDVRGVVQLGSKHFALMHRPSSVSNIIIGVACRSLAILHGTINEERVGNVVGRYRVHFENGKTETIPITYGQDVADWQTDPATIVSLRAAAAYQTSEASGSTWVYVSHWNNPHPDLAIRRLDFEELGMQSAPFLLAITAEGGRDDALWRDGAVKTTQAERRVNP